MIQQNRYRLHAKRCIYLFVYFSLREFSFFVTQGLTEVGRRRHLFVVLFDLLAFLVLVACLDGVSASHAQH